MSLSDLLYRVSTNLFLRFYDQREYDVGPLNVGDLIQIIVESWEKFPQFTHGMSEFLSDGSKSFKQQGCISDKMPWPENGALFKPILPIPWFPHLERR